jgi:hypothetical protein
MDKNYGTYTNMPDQMVSEKQKFSKKWYIPMANYCIDLCTKNRDNGEITKLLNLANGYIPDEEFKYLTKQYGDKQDLDNLPIRHIDFLAEIKDKYMGEFSKSYYYYQVYSLDSDSIALMNKEIEQQVTSMCMQELTNILNAQKEQQAQQQAAEQAAQQQSGEGEQQQEPIEQPPLDTGKESKPVDDIDQWVKDYKENWKDERTIKAQQRLEFINQTLDTRDKYYTLFYYWWATESCYTYREVIGDRLYYYVVSPEEYYRCASGNKYVEDDDYGVWKQYVSFQGLIDMCRHYLDEDELKEVIGLSKYQAASGEVSVPIIQWQGMKIFDDTQDIPGMIKDRDGKHILWNTSNRIEVWRYAYKTPIKHQLLTYMSLQGDVKEKIVPDDYEFDEMAGDIAVHTEWINKVMCGIRVGAFNNGFYSKPRFCECQRELLGNESVCKLPFNGISYIVAENARNPIPKRLEDYIKLYRIFTAQLERAANKFRDLLMIPESLLLGSAEITAEDRLNRANMDAIFPFNDKEIESTNALQAMREIYTSGVERYIQSISNIRAQIREEALHVANFNEARDGNLGQYAGKATTEYALNIAQTGTAWMLEQFNLFRQKDMTANYDWSKVAWVDGMRGSYTDPNTGEVIYLNIDAQEGLLDNIGVSIMHNAQLEEQIQELKQYAFSMGQNGNEIVAVEAITNRNISKLKKVIKEAGENTRKFQIEMQKASEEAKQMTEQVKAQAKQQELAAQMEMLQVELDSKAKTAIEVAEIHKAEAIEVMSMRIASGESDSNGDGYMDNYDKRGKSSEEISIEREKIAAQREANIMNYSVGMDRNRVAAKKAASTKK